MPSFWLTALARRQRNIRRKVIVLREIKPPLTLATGLYQVYARVLSVWEDAAPAIIAQYERALSELVKDDASNIQSEFESAGETATRLVLTMTAPIRDWAIRIEKWQRGKWTAAVKAGTGVDLSMMIGPEDARQTLEAAINWNVSLVKDVSAQVQQRISNAVWTGLRDRTAPREVAAKIREAVAMGRQRSERIAAHQLSSLHAELSQERRREAGLSVFKWNHSFKKHPRPEHQARDGKYYSEDPRFIGKDFEGRTILKAPDSSDRAGIPPFCGCHEQSVLAFLDDDDDEE